MLAPRHPTPRAAVGSAPILAAPAALDADTHGQLINLAGRQRMLSQRIVMLAVLAAQGQADALATALDALRLFSETHATLSTRRGHPPAALDPELHEALFGPDGADAPVRAFIARAERTLGSADIGTAAAAAELARLVAEADPVLKLLNRITSVFESIARRDAQTRRAHQTELIGRIQRIASEARVVSMNARIVAARAGDHGREFAVVAERLTDISAEIETLSRSAAGMA